MVYGAVSRVLLPVSLIALVGVGVWGYQEHNEKNSILIKAENQYQRAFHDLSHTMSKLNDELGKSLVINSRKQATPCLTNVWRLAYTAQSDVGQLPLTLMPFNKTEEFLSKVADFSYNVAIRDLDKEPLTQSEYNTLKKLYEHSKSINKELNHVQTKVIDQRLRWMDVETAIAGDEKKSDNTIIDGFRTIDKQVEEFPEVDWGPGIQNTERKKKIRSEGLKGAKISVQQAKQEARKFLQANNVQIQAATMEVDSNGKSDGYNSYSIRVTPQHQKEAIHLDVTKRGGKVIWMLNERDIKKPKLDLQAAEASAQKFLQKRGYQNMVATESDSYSGLAVFTFVPEVQGVRIYPDSMTVKVALDNGEVVGFHAAEYLFNHKPRQIEGPRISEQKAREMINPNVKATGPNLVIIEGKQDGQEVLCYEFKAEHDGNVYLIYINAENGDEEEIVKMNVHPSGQMA